VEAHDEDITDAQGRRPQGAAATQDHLGQIVVRGRLGQVEFEQLLALGDPDLLGLAGVAQGLLAVDLDLVGDDELGL
jgi:hypothetical protein